MEHAVTQQAFRVLHLATKGCAHKKSRNIYKISQNHSQISQCFSNFFFSLEWKFSSIGSLKSFQWIYLCSVAAPHATGLLPLWSRESSARETKAAFWWWLQTKHNPSCTTASLLRVGQKMLRNWTFMSPLSHPTLVLMIWEIASEIIGRRDTNPSK